MQVWFFLVLVFSVLMDLGVLLLLVKVYKMHDVKNQNGEYAWMVPSEWYSLHSRLVESQNGITNAISEMAANHAKQGELLKHLVNAAFSLTEEINRLKNAKK